MSLGFLPVAALRIHNVKALCDRFASHGYFLCCVVDLPLCEGKGRAGKANPRSALCDWEAFGGGSVNVRGSWMCNT